MLGDRLALLKRDKILNLCILGVCTIACLFVSFAFVSYFGTSGYDLPECNLPVVDVDSVSYEEFKLFNTDAEGDRLKPLLPNIEKNLIYLAFNSRPDYTDNEREIFFGLKGVGNMIGVKSFEKMYFHCSDVDEIAFANEPTPYWIEPRLLTNGSLVVLFRVQYKDCDDSVIYELTEERKIEKPVGVGNLCDDFSTLHSELSKSKIFGKDKVIELYGGDSFSNIKNCYRFEKCQNGSVIYINDGDILYLSEDGWVKESVDARNKPLLLIKKFNNDKCEYTIWGKSGIYSESKTLPIEKSTPLTVKQSELFSKLHFRSDKSVTCHINNCSIILREGDWLLSSKNKWKTMCSLNELNNYLTYKLDGKLFIFDGIERRADKDYFIGHLFDEQRTCIQKIELPLREKKIQKIKKK